MKNFTKGLIIVAAALIIIPLIPAVLSAKGETDFSSLPGITESAAAMAVPGENMNYRYIDTVYIYDEVNKDTISVPVEDYLCAAVLGSISPTAEPELLKAQTVLMYTYILGKRLKAIKSRDSDIYGCDISTDSEKYTRLMWSEEADELYSEKQPDYREKVKAAVGSCQGEFLTYDGKPIVPAYCFSCGGVTESAETVLGEDVPYLSSVKSEYDSEYITEAVYSKDEIFARLALSEEAITLLGPCESWITVSESSETGYVKSLLLDGKYSVNGAEFAKLLNLPSPRFTFGYSEEFDNFTFAVSGVGHLVGLSQYGANEMAKRGADYTEILKKYFVGTEIKISDRIE